MSFSILSSSEFRQCNYKHGHFKPSKWAKKKRTQQLYNLYPLQWIMIQMEFYLDKRMKHILVEIFVVLNSSFIVRKPFRKRGYFLWIFLANLRGYWVVRCGQSVRLCRSARLWVDFGELRCSWPDGGQKIELPTGGQESGRDWAKKSSFSTFTATASCKYDIFLWPR